MKIDGNLYDLDEEITLEKNIKHTVEVVVDRLALRKGIRVRLADSLETARTKVNSIDEVSSSLFCNVDRTDEVSLEVIFSIKCN